MYVICKQRVKFGLNQTIALVVVVTASHVLKRFVDVLLSLHVDAFDMNSV
jgi:hypothetical protein